MFSVYSPNLVDKVFSEVKDRFPRTLSIRLLLVWFVVASTTTLGAIRENLARVYEAENPTPPKPQVINRPPTKGQGKDTPTTKRRTFAPVSAGIRLAYEWFLQLPVPVVLLVMWVGGVVLLGACALLAYAVISAVVRMVAGAF